MINIQNHFFAAYDWAQQTSVAAQEKMFQQLEVSKESIKDVQHVLSQKCRYSCHRFNLTCQSTINKIELFLYLHKETIFFVGCCATTAYFAPFLFFPVAIVTAAVRVEFSRNLKNLSYCYLKEDKNPYKLQPYFEKYITPLDLAFGTIAATDALALGTFFFTTSWTIFLLPAMGGIAAGNYAAKWGMNMSHLLASP